MPVHDICSLMLCSPCFLIPSIFLPLSRRHDHYCQARRRGATTACALPPENKNFDFTTSCTMTVSEGVVRAVRDLYSRANASIHRGRCAHELGRLATEQLQESREAVSNAIRVSNPNEVVFTEDGTTAMRLVANALGGFLNRGDEVLVAVNCPDTTICAWRAAATAHSLDVRLVPAQLATGISPGVEEYATLVGPRTRVVVIPVVCPVTAAAPELMDLMPFLNAIGAKTVLDATTYAMRYTEIDVSTLCSDFVVCDVASIGAARGAFIHASMNVWQRLPPVIGGEHTLQECSLNSSSVDLINDMENWMPIPDRFEASSSCLAVAVAVAAALQTQIQHIQNGFLKRSATLGRYLHTQLRSVDSVAVYSNEDAVLAPFACFNVDNVDPETVRINLEGRGVLCELGCLTTRVAHEGSLGVNGSVRVTLDAEYHDETHVDDFVAILDEVVMDVLAATPPISKRRNC